MPPYTQKPEQKTRPDFIAYQRQFVDYLRDPNNPDNLAGLLPKQIGIYSRLMHNKFEDSLRTCFPFCRELLGTNHWQRLVKLFIQEHRCESPLYREIPDEFIEYLLNGKPGMDLPGYLIDLAHFEWMELVLETANPKPALHLDGMEEAGDVLEDIPVLNPVLHILRYRFPVHTFTLENQAWGMLGNSVREQPVILAGLRDKAYRIHFIEVNAVTARLVELLQEGFRTGRNALLQLAVELKYPSPEAIIPFAEEILDQLVSQHIIQGVKHEI